MESTPAKKKTTHFFLYYGAFLLIILFLSFLKSSYLILLIQKVATNCNIRSKKKFLWIVENFVDSKKFSLTQRNRFVHIEEIFFESTRLSSIQRNFFFDRILKKCFFDSNKLFSGCLSMHIVRGVSVLEIANTFLGHWGDGTI